MKAKQLETIPFVIFVTDKAGGLLLLDSKGKIDFEFGIGSSSETFISRMKELFIYYWETGLYPTDCN